MKRRKLLRIGSLLMGSVGLIIIVAAIFPIVWYNIQEAHNSKEFISPIPEVREEADLTQASSWFPTGITQNEFSKNIAYYNLSIPKLEIKDAVVSMGGEDLSDSLIQYPDTVVPGKVGNTVIFGHSALPTFFNPKDYLTIFSTLPKLKAGDTINLVYDGISYTYKVFDSYEVFPTNLDVLSQKGNVPTLSLITCTPPGDPRSPKRLVIRASLVPPGETNFNDNTIL